MHVEHYLEVFQNVRIFGHRKFLLQSYINLWHYYDMHYQRKEKYYQYDYSDRCFHKKWCVIAFKNRIHEIEFLPDQKIILIRFHATKHIQICFLKYEMKISLKNLKFFFSFFLFRINKSYLESSLVERQKADESCYLQQKIDQDRYRCIECKSIYSRHCR